MDILEAYHKTLGVVEELRQGGINVVVTPSVSTREKDDPLPRDKWVNVKFMVENKAQSDLVRQKSRELGLDGIVFDTGGMQGERDWELDWSFKVRPVPFAEREAAQDTVEEIIEDIEKKGAP